MTTEASQQRIEALRRKLSNQANGEVPVPEVPGAPFTAQSSGNYSAGNAASMDKPTESTDAAAKPVRELDGSPPYGRYHPRECELVSPTKISSQPLFGDAIGDTYVEPSPTPSAPAVPDGLKTPEAVAPAPSPEMENLGESASAVEDMPEEDQAQMPPPSNPYWKFLESKVMDM